MLTVETTTVKARRVRAGRPAPAAGEPRPSGARPPWMEKTTRLGLVLKGLALVIIVDLVAYPLLGVIGTSFASQSVPWVRRLSLRPGTPM
ncbi:hypothetical protein ACWDE9_17020 [Streptomyces olivaceoviridis]|uniref:hypothetical protein n=1 Tax=Streptomyces olivaceoviridis TaxID=1921 RepID=UPI0019A1CE5A|nr:hypothetical protein [Streptomyces olivaceoviridis]GGZ25576.1 hypothetical protein GCM10010300_81200 [Streptomyces olivaceoviridis]